MAAGLKDASLSTEQHPTSEPQNALFKALLGKHASVQEALDQASKDIAAIASRKPNVPRAVRRNGVATVRLYDFTPRR